MATYYWVGGSGTWDNSSTTNWATSSGGAGGNGPPLVTDTVNFDALSGTAATVTVASTAVSLNTTVNKADINLSLSGSPTLCPVAGTLTITAATLTLNTYTLTIGAFSSTNTNTRAIAFGTGNITLTGSDKAIWSTATSTGFSYTGTPTVNSTYSGAVGSRTIQSANTAGATESNVVSFNISAGTDAIALSSAGSVKSINFTGFSGALSNNGYTAYGDVTFSGTMTTATTPSVIFAATSGTQKLKTNGWGLNFALTVNCPGATVQLQDACNVTNTSSVAFTLTAGSLDLGGYDLTVAGRFSSTTANTRAILFGSNQIKLSGNNTTLLNISNLTNFTYTGTPIINCTYAGAVGTRNIVFGTTGFTESNTPSIYVSAGSDIFTSGGSCVIKDLNFVGFSGTLGMFARDLYGSLTLSPTMTLTAGSNTTLFVSTSSGKTITTATKTLDFPTTFNGIGGTWAFQDALTQGATRAFTITNGTVKLKEGVTSTTGVFTTSGTNQKYLYSATPGTLATLTQASGTVNASYLTIKDIAAIGGATWNALWSNNNVDAGDNSGWFFGDPPIINAVEYTYRLRSFTQPRRF